MKKMQALYIIVAFNQGSAVENGRASDHEIKQEADRERETDEPTVESNTREPSLPPSTAG